MTTKTRIVPHVEVPELDHDAMMSRKFGTKVGPRGRLERRIVAALVQHLDKAGFRPSHVWDGDTCTEVHDTKSVMELVFNLDEVSVRFIAKGKPVPKPDEEDRNQFAEDERGVLLMLGEGCDIVADWNYDVGDRDGFNKAMKSFDAELFA